MSSVPAMSATPPTPARTTVNGLEFAYVEAGPASGPLALCLHGFPDSAHGWQPLLAALADAGFHAVAPFMRGYAPTAVPADGTSPLSAWIADVDAMHGAFGGSDAVTTFDHLSAPKLAAP